MSAPFPTQRFAQDNIPHWRCPACLNESLELKPDTFSSERSAYSLRHYREDWYDMDQEEFVFSCLLQCGRDACREKVAVSGIGYAEMDWEVYPVQEMYYVAYRAKSFVPPLPVFNVPEDCPDEVKQQLKAVSALLPVNDGAAVNALRITLELLLDTLDIPRHWQGNPGKHATAGVRIEQNKAALGELYSYFDALKDIGNHGSHTPAPIAASHIEGACTLLDALLLQMFPVKQDFSKIHALLKQAYGKPPRGQ